MYNFDLMGYEVPSYALQLRPHASTHIPLATQSVWCGDVADLVEPPYELMAEKVRTSHVVCADDTNHAHAEHGQSRECKDVGLRL